MSLFVDVKTLVDEIGTGVFWVDQQVYDACNQAQLEMWGEVKFAQITGTLTATASNDIGVIPSTIMIPQYFVGSGGRYYNTTHVQLENWNREWKKVKPTYPKWIVMWDESHVRFWPKPDQTYTYEIVGVSWPDAIDSGNQDVNLPYLAKKALAAKAASLLVEMTLPDLSESLEAESKYNLNKWTVSLDNQQSHNIRRMRPGTAFNTAQSGSIGVGKRFK